MSINALRGMNDIFGADAVLWREVETKARDIFERFRFQEMRTPVLEDMSLFTRTLGDTTNVVEKEMYVFQDRNAKWVALRPEGTASIVRAYIEHKQFAESPIARYYYMGPMYRYERPQKGRFRQFHQLGAEVLGIGSARLDAEVIHMLEEYFRVLGLADVTLEINSLGCPICRPNFLRAFFHHIHQNEERLCSDCKRRMEKNPLRILDCKTEGCIAVANEGPSIQDHLCETCEKDFDTVLETLGLLGSTYKVNPKIVRGLDYYQKTTFEFTSNLLGSQNAVAGGGRYDGLTHLLGGPNVPGFGFAIGLERLIDILKELRKAPEERKREGVFLVAMGDEALNETLKLAQTLRREGLSVDMDYEGKSLKSQMRRADKVGALHVGILGSDELAKKVISLRNLVTGVQEEVAFADVASKLKQA